jgi:hypothetical protein
MIGNGFANPGATLRHPISRPDPVVDINGAGLDRYMYFWGEYNWRTGRSSGGSSTSLTAGSVALTASREGGSPIRVTAWLLPCYHHHRFPAEIIQHAIWHYLRFTLSCRDVEDLLADRGFDVSYEAVRRWALKFGPTIARRLRRPASAERPVAFWTR